MTLQLQRINLGSAPQGKDGNTQREASGKTNDNMAEIEAFSNALASDVTAIRAAADALSSDATSHTGSVAMFACKTPPAGWLKCNGAAVSRTTYERLFKLIGTTFGAGDGAATFNLPELRAEFPRGWDDGRGVDSGRAFGSSQAQALSSHQHKTAVGFDGSNLFGWGDGSATPIFGSEVQAGVLRVVGAVTQSGGAARIGYTDVTPMGVSGETRPRNVALLACIKY
ncbi:phage tail protein [Ralstonia solanacearum]|uniref:phage tail protein n=2 Tax=Ralstonia solanacearum TaxID=305 RepID=UPI000181699B|nr:phage tail protein [Ralstonia solanacearum]MDC6179036.1 phage tail protein [Ralstonia solanacearum]MDC6240266.1 phage tail protein [Ralstonia solanacearum]TYZ55339.1 phage tail protein [Ralstonia solanacearum]